MPSFSTDDQHDDAGEEADGQGYPCAVDDTDEVVTSGGIGTEDVGEDGLTGFDQLLLRGAVLKGSQIVIGGVYGLAGLDAQLGVIGVGPEHGQENGHEGDNNNNEETDRGDLVLQQTLDTVLEERGRRAHLHHIFLFGLGGGDEIIHFNVEARKFLLIHN